MTGPSRGAEHTPWIWPPTIIVGMSIGNWLASAKGALLAAAIVVVMLLSRRSGST